jgi:hypothetical protein
MNVNDPGHWWTWYLKGNNAARNCYAAGLWIYLADVGGKLGVVVESRMNAKIRGLTGTVFREKITSLPPGNDANWIAGGVVSQEIALPADRDLPRWLDGVLESTKLHLAFLDGVYRAVASA